MRITRLLASNFKGQTFEHELAPITIFTGRNARGKSARLEALVLALAGYIPGKSKKPNELFEQFANRSPMGVCAYTDTQQHGAIQRTWKDDRGSIKYDSYGGDFPLIAFDATEYLGLSDIERTRFLFKVATLPQGFTIPNLANQICAKVKNIKLEKNTPATEMVINKVVELISKNDEIDLAYTVQDWIGGLVECIKERKLNANANVKRMAQTSQGLTQLAGEQTPASQDAEQKMEKARAELTKSEDRKRELEVKIERTRIAWREAKALADTIGEQGKWQERLEELKQQKQKMRHVAKPGKEPAWSVTPSAEAYQHGCDDLKNKIIAASGGKKCPTCGHIGEPNLKLVKKLERELKAAKAELAKAKKSEAEVEAKHNKWCELSTAYAGYIEASRLIEQEESELNANLAKCASAMETAANLPRLTEEGKQLGLELTKAKEDLEECSCTFTLADRGYRQLLADRAEAKARAAATEQALAVKAEAEVYKEVYQLLISLQSELVEKCVEPILKTCNELCSDILREPLVYRDGIIGMVDKASGKFITHKSMSDSEQALVYAAVQIALANKAPIRLAIIPRLEAFDADNQIQLIHKLMELIETKKIDQAVCVLVGVPGCVPLADSVKEIML